MKNLFLFVTVVLLPLDATAESGFQRFRWDGTNGSLPASLARKKTENPLLLLSGLRLGKEIPEISPLAAAGETVIREAQQVDGAEIAGSWSQTVLNSAGKVVYTAGELTDPPSAAQLELAGVRLGKEAALAVAESKVPELSESKRFPARLQLRRQNGIWQAYWRVEYLTKKEDRVKFLHIARDGTILERGEIPWDGADGRALVYPKGPRLSELKEETLRDLVGDGNLTGSTLSVRSALNLSVWSPELKFIFPQEDRRFDMAQAYFTINSGLIWMKEKLGVEPRSLLEVRVHVGENGVSNAAFYHQNTIYLGSGDGITYRDLLRDPSVLVHEGMHALIDVYAGFPSDGEGGSFNEGFADLLTALILDNPRMGEVSYMKAPFRRTLENNLRAYRDFTAGVYQNGSIVAATFWDMRAQLGNEKTAQLAFRTLTRLGRGAKFDDFGGALSAAATGLLDEGQREFVLGAARNRGWKL